MKSERKHNFLIRVLLRMMAPVLRHPAGRFLKTLQFQLMIVFGISLIVFYLSTNIANGVLGRVISSAHVDYAMSLSQLDSDAQNVVGAITTPNMYQDGSGKPTPLQQILNNQRSQSNEQVFIMDTTGNVLLGSDNVQQTQIDMQRLVQQATSAVDSQNPTDTAVRMYPVQYNGKASYVVVEGVPTPNLVYVQANNPLANVIGLVTFVLTFYWLTRKRVQYLKTLGEGLNRIAEGNLDFRVQENGEDELTRLAANINHMANQLQVQIEAERRAEKTKSELITNVSHDLRTPLTLVMGYLRLLKDRKFENDEQFDAYVNIAFDKSEKLNGLILNLFEYTKLTSHGVRLDYRDVSLNELLGQLMEELVSVAEESHIELHREFDHERFMVRVDPEQMSRVFENLLNNGIQHSHKPGNIHVRLLKDANEAVVCIMNQGDPIPKDELPRLFERFYRPDKSRTSSQGGSGLGLAIAKSIVDLHEGTILCESEDNEIRFTVRLPLVLDESLYRVYGGATVGESARMAPTPVGLGSEA